MQQGFFRLLPLIRPLWPLNITRRPPRPRLFTSKAPYLDVSRPATRVQLPFLSTTYKTRRKPLTIRLLSTEQKADIKYQLRLGIYWTLIGWTLLLGAGSLFWAARGHWLDQCYPSPEEWNLVARTYWRNAKHEESSDGYGTGVMDWGSIGTRYRAVVGLLEDKKSGLREQTDCDPTIPGLNAVDMRTAPETHDIGQLWPSRTGFDITMKSEPWRRGYYEAMMGMAKGSEMRAGWMTHKVTKKVFPPEHVKSSDNPYPKPLPPGTPLELPDISECWPTLEAPEFHYKRILTTTGFNRKQRMDAGLAYASWLEHSGDQNLAQQMLHWSLNLAVEGLGSTTISNTPAETIDHSTAVIPANAPFTTPNILETATALANHHARLGDITTALPIYLSVLRARRSAPAAPASKQYYAQPPDLSLKSSESFFRYLRTVPWDADFPAPPPNGDEVFERRRGDECAEAALMAYVGEILFAKAGRRKEGLRWTQDAVDLAERAGADSKVGERARKVCEQCIGTGLENWKNMTAKLARETKEAQAVAETPEAAPAQSKGWLWQLRSAVTTGGDERALLKEQDWVAEERRAQKRLTDFEEKKLNRTLSAMISGTSSWFVI